MKLPRAQIFFGLFFLLWFINCVLSHSVGREFLDTAQKMAELSEEERAEFQPDESQQNQGFALLFTNLPLFLGLGLIVRGEDPGAGPFYWALVVLGSVYLPAFITLCIYLIATPPSAGISMPGVDWDDGSLPEDDDDD